MPYVHVEDVFLNGFAASRYALGLLLLLLLILLLLLLLLLLLPPLPLLLLRPANFQKSVLIRCGFPREHFDGFYCGGFQVSYFLFIQVSIL